MMISTIILDIVRYIFAEIFIVDKTRPRKDLIFFHVWSLLEMLIEAKNYLCSTFLYLAFNYLKLNRLICNQATLMYVSHVSIKIKFT